MLATGARIIYLCSPNNPTGNLLSEERMRKIAAMASGPDAPMIVSDEIYHGLVYEGHDHSILEFTDRAFVLNGFSKLFAMTGLRLGYVIAPPSLVRPMQKLQQNFFISANSMVQKAAIAALQCAGDDVAGATNCRLVYLDAIRVMTGAARLGGVQALSEGHRRFIETWEVEAYRKQIARSGSAGRMAGRIAVVTGAAQGFGLEIANQFAAEGGVAVLADVNHTMTIMREETFGPIAPVCAFDTVSDALAIANGTPYGLAAYLFTADGAVSRPSSPTSWVRACSLRRRVSCSVLSFGRNWPNCASSS